jgi:hypothetical protein
VRDAAAVKVMPLSLILGQRLFVAASAEIMEFAPNLLGPSACLMPEEDGAQGSFRFARGGGLCRMLLGQADYSLVVVTEYRPIRH